jgi:hypothetical protein
MNYLYIVAAIAGVLLAAELLIEFHDWNRQQACVSSGGRNCGGARMMPSH